MKKNRISKRTIALIAAALVLFAGGTYTGTRAVLNVYSPEHFLIFDTDSQSVQILENGVAATTLLSDLNGKIIPGKENKEEIRAKNITPDADQFVRIVIRKYWRDADGNKATDIDEKLLGKIKLEFDSTGLWQKNDAETTPEREVYYYKKVVPGGNVTDSVTEPLTSTLTVDNSVATEPTVSEPDENGVITYSYKLDGYQVCIEAEAQSIQTHSAQKAVRSIWGVTNVTASGSTLTVH